MLWRSRIETTRALFCLVAANQPRSSRRSSRGVRLYDKLARVEERREGTWSGMESGYDTSDLVGPRLRTGGPTATSGFELQC
jgi:hypothetical protein